MWIVLAHEQDTPARWAAGGLRDRGLEPLIWLEAEQLAQAVAWSHRLGRGEVSLEVRLSSGRTIESHEIKGVLNRLLQVPGGHIRPVKPSDRLYTFQEMAAFYLSWLNGLNCPVLNLPQPNGMAGPMMQSSVWYVLASRAGLKTLPLRLNSRQPVHEIWGLHDPTTSARDGDRTVQVFVVDGQVIDTDTVPALPKRIRDGCVNLARLVNVRLLGLRFSRDSPGQWIFVGADVLPDLREGGTALLDALAMRLSSEATDSQILGSSGISKTEETGPATSDITDRLIFEAGGALISETGESLNYEAAGDKKADPADRVLRPAGGRNP